jgi:magnesium chelatase subunit D
LNVTERVSAALGCAAIDRELAGILLLDLDPGLLYPLARWLAERLGSGAPVISLGIMQTEDVLWERIRPRQDGPGFRLATGPLVEGGRQPGVIMVPDLALLSLPAARAASTLIGAEVAHLERVGNSVTWRPADRWIAAVRRTDVGRVSPHLLDRFAVRVDAAGLRSQAWGEAGDLDVLGPPDSAWEQAIGNGRLPAFGAEAADRVLALVPPDAPGFRRQLALGRLARALACLGDAQETTVGYVDAAAELTGLAGNSGPAGETSDPGQQWLSEAGRPAWPSATPNGEPLHPAGVPQGGDHDLVSGVPDNMRPHPDGGPPNGNGAGNGMTDLPPEDVDAPAGPYPEDKARPARDADPLRLGWPQPLGGPAHGHPFSTAHAPDARDIAVTATLLRAAMFQAVRCPDGVVRHYGREHPLHVRGTDLLRHRRVRHSGCLLVLLLDHTCRADGWDWYGALAPYLRWAFTSRAPIGVVEVGRADTANELRADQFRSRRLLDARVAEALGRAPGQATPLAHGLSMACTMLRHDTQQGSGPVADAVLVVATDGRGNVPLSASRTAQVQHQVGRRGITDALRVAGQIRRLNRVRSVVIDPGPRPHGHLTADLAAALGGPLARARPVAQDEWPRATRPDTAGGAL